MPSSHDFYSGLVARLYQPLRAFAPDPEPYARFVLRSGEPALELGCGDGDPMLELRARGIDVEGLDTSADMLHRCRIEAARRGLSVTLHHQAMETMALARTFRSIYLAGPTFNLLPNDDAAAQALARIREHLAPAGTALVPLFIPRPTPAAQLGRARQTRTEDGTVMRFTAMSEVRDDVARTQTTAVRYELDSAEEQLREDRSWMLHWYTPAQFTDLAESVGLQVRPPRGLDGQPATADTESFTALLTTA